MKLYIAGGCSEHGRNSFLVMGKELSFLVDAGAMKEKPDKPWPELTREQIGRVRYLFLTHCHTDHTGALSWLYENGFAGTVVASRYTLANIAGRARRWERLEDYAGPLTEFAFHDGLRVMWGRSGHCIGSVWYRFALEDRSILFTGDYEERSYAYECDRIRGVAADAAVVDSAYGYEREDAEDHRKAIEARLDELLETGAPLLFPVPSHGRGFDVLKLLAERGVTAVLSKAIVREYRMAEDRERWLKKSFLTSIAKLVWRDVGEFERRLENPREGESFPEEFRRSGILVRDSQLYKEVNRRTAEAVVRAGGRIVLTGKQDPASFARAALDRGVADFCRISVHQNVDEMKRLAARNRFRTVIPYHCRQALTFEAENILVRQPGDTVEF